MLVRLSLQNWQNLACGLRPSSEQGLLISVFEVRYEVADVQLINVNVDLVSSPLSDINPTRGCSLEIQDLRRRLVGNPLSHRPVSLWLRN